MEQRKKRVYQIIVDGRADKVRFRYRKKVLAYDHLEAEHIACASAYNPFDTSIDDKVYFMDGASEIAATVMHDWKEHADLTEHDDKVIAGIKDGSIIDIEERWKW